MPCRNGCGIAYRCGNIPCKKIRLKGERIMNNIRTVFFGMLKRLKYALVIALLVGAGSIGLYYCGRPIANVFSVNDKIDIALTDNDKSELSAMLKSYLSDRINMNIIEDGKEKFNDKLINRDVSAIIEIP